MSSSGFLASRNKYYTVNIPLTYTLIAVCYTYDNYTILSPIATLYPYPYPCTYTYLLKYTRYDTPRVNRSLPFRVFDRDPVLSRAPIQPATAVAPIQAVIPLYSAVPKPTLARFEAPPAHAQRYKPLLDVCAPLPLSTARAQASPRHLGPRLTSSSSLESQTCAVFSN
ncbi:hypothetical protein F5883DRAFT_576438 [Diaporthe sp. PMI_573]|nr:hypothetical protein F5883DRAFT_576438 [Diaporthaceae sp. PMI_573]